MYLAAQLGCELTQGMDWFKVSLQYRCLEEGMVMTMTANSKHLLYTRPHAKDFIYIIPHKNPLLFPLCR